MILAPENRTPGHGAVGLAMPSLSSSRLAGAMRAIMVPTNKDETDVAQLTSLVRGGRRSIADAGSFGDVREVRAAVDALAAQQKKRRRCRGDDRRGHRDPYPGQPAHR